LILPRIKTGFWKLRGWLCPGQNSFPYGNRVKNGLFQRENKRTFAPVCPVFPMSAPGEKGDFPREKQLRCKRNSSKHFIEK